MDNSVPVVLIKRSGGYGALAVARTLGRLGVRTYLITQGKDAVSSSRYWTKSFFWDFSAPNAQSLEFVLNVGREIGSRPLLFSILDWGALFIEDNAAALAERFLFPQSPPSVIQVLTNKWLMCLAAREHGIPTPDTVCPQSRHEVERYLQTARFPVVMKGADQRSAHANLKGVLYDAHEVLARYDAAAEHGSPSLILQEYIPGGDDSVWMCDAYCGVDSECNAIFTGQKLRQWSDVGVATLAVCLPNATVEDATRKFMRAVGYRGLVDIGYRFDARDGLYKILDVNPRASGVVRLFRDPNGMDVVRACYLDLTGQPVPVTTLSIGRKWMLEEDVFIAIAQVRKKSLSLREWFRSLRGVRETHWFAADDLAPFLLWLWRRLGVTSRVSGMWRRLRPARMAPLELRPSRPQSHPNATP